jgi:hypothetical protein
MDASKKKQIEARLRRLMEAADRGPQTQTPSGSLVTGTVQVIWRRKGRPGLEVNAASA